MPGDLLKLELLFPLQPEELRFRVFHGSTASAESQCTRCCSVCPDSHMSFVTELRIVLTKPRAPLAQRTMLHSDTSLFNGTTFHVDDHVGRVCRPPRVPPDVEHRVLWEAPPGLVSGRAAWRPNSATARSAGRGSATQASPVSLCVTQRFCTTASLWYPAPSLAFWTSSRLSFSFCVSHSRSSPLPAMMNTSPRTTLSRPPPQGSPLREFW